MGAQTLSVTHALDAAQNSVLIGTQYTYMVVAADRLGNESVPSGTVSVSLLTDTIAPTVTESAMSPNTSGYRYITGTYTSYSILKDAVTFSITVRDDQKAVTALLERSADGTTYTAIGTASLAYAGSAGSGLYYFSCSIPFDTASAADGLYFFRLTVTDAAGNTASAVRKYFIDNTPPAAPTDFAASGAARGAALTWGYPAGADIYYFRLYYGTDSNLQSASSVWISGTERSYTLRGLTAGTTYYFKLAAMDDSYHETYTGSVSAVPFVDTEAPVVTAVTPVTDTRLRIAYINITATDNVGVTQYRVYTSPEGTETYTQTAVSSYGYFTLSDENLDGWYDVKVTALDEAENESSPYVLRYFFDYTAPAVTGLAVAGTSGGITLVWDRAADEDLSYYYLYRKSPTDNDYALYAYVSLANQTGSTMTYTDYRVSTGLLYRYKLRASDTLGNQSALGTGDEGSVSGAPQEYSPTMTLSPVTGVTGGSVITVTASGLAPNDTVKGYIDDLADAIFTVYADGAGRAAVNWSYVKNTSSGQHTIRLEGVYTGVPMQAAFTAISEQLPAPGNLAATGGLMKIDLSWSAVSGASYYRIYRAEKVGDTQGEMLLYNTRVTGTYYTDTAVQRNAVYTYAVSAVDRYGAEGIKSESTFAIPTSDTGEPQITGFAATRSGNILRLIATVADDVALGKVTFSYKTYGEDDSTYITIKEAALTGKSASAICDFDTSALSGQYLFRAVAMDSAGLYSVPSTIATTVSTDKPEAVQDLAAAAGEMKISLTWQAPGVINNEIAQYRIYRASGGDYALYASTTLTHFDDKDVSLGTSYSYKVTAVDTFGYEGTETVTAAAVAPLADITAPQVTGYTTAAGTRIRGDFAFGIIASDNVGVTYIDVYMKTGETWASIGRTETGSITVSTAAIMTEGDLTFKAVAFDAAGNSGENTVTYTVDNVAPPVPALTVAATELSVTLRWTMASVPTDFAYYNVYIYVPASGETPESRSFLGKTTAQLYVHSTSALTYYCVTSVDTLGNESAYSSPVSCVPGADKTAPVITALTPSGTVREDTAINAVATDNVGVLRYVFDITPLFEDAATGALNPANNPVWTVLADSGSASVTWETLTVAAGQEAMYPDGAYYLRATVYDAAGNASATMTTVKISNSPPSAPEGLRVDASEWGFIVSWKPATGSDVAGYSVMRKIGGGDYEKLDVTSSNIHIEKSADPSVNYYFKVAIQNDLGNLGPYTEDYSGAGTIPSGIVINSNPQTSTPVITAMTPSANKKFNAGLDIAVQISDGVRVSKVMLYLKPDGADDSAYYNFAVIDGADIHLENVTTSEYDVFGTDLFVARYHLDAVSAGMEPGAYQIKAVVYNMGAKTTEAVRKYIRSTAAPDATSATATDTMTGGTVDLRWTAGSDVEQYEVYRSTDAQAAFDTYGDPLATTKSPVYIDSGLDDGTAYYYHIVVVDTAGNSSAPSARVGATPSAVSDLDVVSVTADPATVVAGRTNTITAQIRNMGTANASGRVNFYYYDTASSDYVSIGYTDMSLAASASRIVSYKWAGTPATLPNPLTIKAVVVTDPSTEDNNDTNNEKINDAVVTNSAPTAVITAPTQGLESGKTLSFDAALSTDTGGRIISYKWDFGNGKKAESIRATTAYAAPGIYTVTLTVKDDLGADTVTTQKITIGDSRPDLYVQAITWTPAEPTEGSVVTITATIGNKGLGDAALGFLTGFYIDGQYMGYVKKDVGDGGISLAMGQTIDVSFNYVAAAGTHIVRVAANDILTALSETDKGNNSKSAVLSNRQILFADVSVDSVTWEPLGVSFSTQEPFFYRAVISNSGGPRGGELFRLALRGRRVQGAPDHKQSCDRGGKDPRLQDHPDGRGT